MRLFTQSRTLLQWGCRWPPVGGGGKYGSSPAQLRRRYQKPALRTSISFSFCEFKFRWSPEGSSQSEQNLFPHGRTAPSTPKLNTHRGSWGLDQGFFFIFSSGKLPVMFSASVCASFGGGESRGCFRFGPWSRFSTAELLAMFFLLGLCCMALFA